MGLVVILGFWVCATGLQKGEKRSLKFMMVGLFALLVVMIIRSITLPGAGEGLSFYLKPDFSNLSWEGVAAAMGHTFFTLSLGIGSMTIFGSYIGKRKIPCW